MHKALRLNINVETTPCLQYYTSGSNFKHYSRKPLWGYAKGHWVHLTKDLYSNYKFCSPNPLVIHREAQPFLEALILEIELKSIAIYKFRTTNKKNIITENNSNEQIKNF